MGNNSGCVKKNSASNTYEYFDYMVDVYPYDENNNPSNQSVGCKYVVPENPYITILAAGGGGGGGLDVNCRSGPVFPPPYVYVYPMGLPGGGGGGGTFLQLQCLLKPGSTITLYNGLGGNGGFDGSDGIKGGCSAIIFDEKETIVIPGGKGGGGASNGTYEPTTCCNNARSGNGGEGGEQAYRISNGNKDDRIYLKNGDIVDGYYKVISDVTSYGGGGALYVDCQSPKVNYIVGKGGLGFINGNISSEYNGIDGSIATLRGGAGGGSLSPRGGKVINDYLISDGNGVAITSSGGGSGGSCGNDKPVSNDNESHCIVGNLSSCGNSGAGGGFSIRTGFSSISTNNAYDGINGFGGGGGVGTNTLIPRVSSCKASRGGNGKIIISHSWSFSNKI